MYLLPKEHPAQKKILDNATSTCDIYTSDSMENTKTQIEEFMRFIEIHLNKIKRVPTKKPRVRLTNHNI